MKKIITLSICLLFVFISSGLSLADDVLDNYKSQISDLKAAISSKALDLKLAASESRTEDNLAYSSRESRARALDRKKSAEAAFKGLEKEINGLKSEMVKYYKGKVPNKLMKGINELLLTYYQTQTDISVYMINLTLDK